MGCDSGRLKIRLGPEDLSRPDLLRQGAVGAAGPGVVDRRQQRAC